jgi:hypothetical protein
VHPHQGLVGVVAQVTADPGRSVVGRREEEPPAAVAGRRAAAAGTQTGSRALRTSAVVELKRPAVNRDRRVRRVDVTVRC